MSKNTPRTDRLEKIVAELEAKIKALENENKIYEERLDDLEMEEFSKIIKEFGENKAEQVESFKDVQPFTMSEIDRVAKTLETQFEMCEHYEIKVMDLQGNPILNLVKKPGNTKPIKIIPRQTKTRCGNCAWGSANTCILGFTDSATCGRFEQRQFRGR